MKIQSESIKTHVAVEANRTRESTKKSIVEQSHRIENNISSTLRTIKVAETSKEDRARLLESLRYPGMKSRQNQIKDPYYETFEWIFKSPSHYEDKVRCNQRSLHMVERRCLDTCRGTGRRLLETTTIPIPWYFL